MPEHITRELVTEWAYGRIDIELAESSDDGDIAIFASTVKSILGTKGLLEFASDPRCLNRRYFANHLATTFLWLFRTGNELPLHFSRFLGIKSMQEYRRSREKREEKVYEICQVLDSMRQIKDPAIQALYKQFLDLRHDYSENIRVFYYKQMPNLNLELFRVETGLEADNQP